VTSQLPTISDLMEHYGVPGLNTIRQAQQLLVEDGLVETRQGVGAFVLRLEPVPRPVDVLAELRTAPRRAHPCDPHPTAVVAFARPKPLH
jgi:DNA-binding GntR family transcriptional regulator